MGANDVDGRRSDNPRVLHLSPVSFGADGTFGGGERYPYELARAMARQAPTTYLTFSAAERGRRVTEGGLEVVKLRNWRLLGRKPLDAFSPRLLGLVRSHDVLHLHQWESLGSNALTMLARISGVPVFATDHGGVTRNFWRRLHLDRSLTGFLPVSEFSASFYPEMRGITHTIMGGVDTAEFQPGDHSERRDHALFVGRLMPHKGIDVLIDALDEETELRVVGRPQDPGFLVHLRELAVGKRVTFVLDASDERIRAEYQQARVAVLPSLHEPPRGNLAPKSELLGLTLLEAMASGTPAICTRTGGMPEVVLDGVTGRVVQPGDAPELRHAVQTIIADKEAWVPLSQQARQRVLDEFTWSRVATRCLDAYRRPTRPEPEATAG